LANIKSAEKRNRTNEKNRQKNSQVKSAVRTISKKTLGVIEASTKATPEQAVEALKGFSKAMDSAVKKGVFHWKKAARLKSRMAKKVNALS